MLDLLRRPINTNAYGERPYTFLDQAAHNDLANITAIDLIENGDRAARENWQNRQLTNLLKHVHTRSAFWRKRMPSRMIGYGMLNYLPVQSREDVADQVRLEGALLANDRNAPVSTYASTGSTGTPVKIYTSQENGYYNLLRGLAQYFINDLSLDETRVQISPPIRTAKLKNASLAVDTSRSWAGPLSKVFRNRQSKQIVYRNDDALIKELLREPVGYLVSPSRYVEILLDAGGIDLVKKLGIRLWFHLSDYRDPEVVKILADLGVRSLSNYSAGEIGPIAYECTKHQGCFHVAHTNVLVECDPELTVSYNGATLGRLLITHLHSYATPIIRYDIGDFGQVENKCRCGHDGPTISNIFGRGKHFMRLPDGKLRPFYLSTRLLQEIVAFKECRVRQPNNETITIEIGGRDSLTADEENKVKEVLLKITDPSFTIVIKTTKEIDWSSSPKRLFFSSSVT
jgi:phenylacetate-coenzyme A ligase PaaK-like adenylate-forming protein